jgi:DNA (cytosine-5)-methyltransferase 1
MISLQQYRSALGVDQLAFAALLGFDPNALSDLQAMEAGRKSIPNKVLQQLIRLPNKLPFIADQSVQKRFSFVDLFAGIGGIRLPFQMRGGQCVFTSERDKHAKITYAANFGEAPAGTGDITEVSAAEIPNHDLLLAGFPCQAFSQAGLRGGFYDTRGTMFFEIQRILAHHRPKAFLLENVKQLKGHDSGNTLRTIMAVLRGSSVPNIPKDIPLSAEARKSLSIPLGYNTSFRILRARDYGVPQNRERIYIVGIRKDLSEPDASDDLIRKMFDRVEAKPYPVRTFGDILERDPDLTDPFTISERLWKGHVDRKARHVSNGNGFGYSLFDEDDLYCNTISARYYKDGSEILVSRGDGKRPRKLTPREAARIQGFPENFFIDAVSTAQIYKQFGNSVAMPVIDAVASELLPLMGVETSSESGQWPM